MNEAYFALRLTEELRLAERATSDAERWVRLRACYRLCCLLGMRMDRRMALSRVQRRRRRGPD